MQGELIYKSKECPSQPLAGTLVFGLRTPKPASLYGFVMILEEKEYQSRMSHWIKVTQFDPIGGVSGRDQVSAAKLLWLCLSFGAYSFTHQA